MTINERFFKLLAESGISQKEFSTKTAIPTQTISGWKSRKTDPPACLISSIADFFNVSIEFLLTGESTSSYETNSFLKKYLQLSPSDKEKVNIFIDIALINSLHEYNNDSHPLNIIREESSYASENVIPILGKVAAGEPILACETQLDSIVAENTNSTYALIAQGNSMYPIINDGETIEVITQKVLENGEIGIIKVGDAVTCKRFYNMDDYFELRSLNPEFDTLKIQKNSSTTLQIVGKVALTKEQLSRF